VGAILVSFFENESKSKHFAIAESPFPRILRYGKLRHPESPLASRDTVRTHIVASNGVSTVSDLMLDVDQAGELKAAFRRGNWTNAEIKTLCEGDVLADVRRVILGHAEIKAAIRNVPATPPFTPDSFVLAMNYDEPIESLVLAGRYDYANSDITSLHFPTKRSGAANLAGRLVHFNRAMSTKEAVKELGEMGLRPGELHELLAFGIRFPEEQRKYPIIGLGSAWQNPHGFRCVPYLDRDGSERSLVLYWLEVDWFDRCRFLAFPK
jgi:hypothetical protein